MIEATEPITIAEYCKRHGVSSQSIYAKIKRGTIEHTIVNGVKMVFDDNATEVGSGVVNTFNANDDAVVQLLQSIVNDLKKENKRLKKYIKRLENQHLDDNVFVRNLLLDLSKPKIEHKKDKKPKIKKSNRDKKSKRKKHKK